jgi:hypothetical protein
VTTDDADEEGDDETVTPGDYESALVMSLEALARIAHHLANSLQRGERPARFARSITELRSIRTLCLGEAGRLAEHSGTPLMWTSDPEIAPVEVPPKGTLGRGDRIARLLANAFCEIVPPQVRVEVSDRELWYCRDDGGEGLGATGLAISDSLADDSGPREDAIRRISSDALARLQRFVTEVTGETWPPGADAPSARSRLEEGILRLWLEDGGKALLECRPIEL